MPDARRVLPFGLRGEPETDALAEVPGPVDFGGGQVIRGTGVGDAVLLFGDLALADPELAERHLADE